MAKYRNVTIAKGNLMDVDAFAYESQLIAPLRTATDRVFRTESLEHCL